MRGCPEQQLYKINIIHEILVRWNSFIFLYFYFFPFCSIAFSSHIVAFPRSTHKPVVLRFLEETISKGKFLRIIQGNSCLGKIAGIIKKHI